MQPLGITLMAVGFVGALFRLADVLRKRWRKPDQVVFGAFLRLRWGLVLLVLWRSWPVVFGCVALGLKLVGVIPTWQAMLLWWFWGFLGAFGAQWLYEAAEARREDRAFEAFRRYRKSIRQDLAAARSLLPAEAAGSVPLTRFERWMVIGELESAFDELAAAGQGGGCPPEFWQTMGRAARKLGLHDEAEDISKRYELPPD